MAQRQHQADTSELEGTKKKNKKGESVFCLNSRKDDVQEEKKSSEKQRVSRTVILGGLVSPEMREAVIERAKKVGSVESIQSSLSPQELKGRGLEKDGCKAGAAAVVFKSVKAASQAVAELHQKSIVNGIVWARQLGGEGSKPRKWRVIIRNLRFTITEEKIRELFSSSGFVWEATVPRKEDGHDDTPSTPANTIIAPLQTVSRELVVQASIRSQHEADVILDDWDSADLDNTELVVALGLGEPMKDHRRSKKSPLQQSPLSSTSLPSLDSPAQPKDKPKLQRPKGGDELPFEELPQGWL
ncbi:hypothetical protein L7F22_042797 [Adiantum nelumboides]|nr:hypothetical protein [Adiantum nelumboides]